jgi:hypothetical protein
VVVGAGVAWMRLGGSLGSGVRELSLGVRARGARARRLRSWGLVEGWGSEIARRLRPGGCGPCVGFSGPVWVPCRLIGPSAQARLKRGFRGDFGVES